MRINKIILSLLSAVLLVAALQGAGWAHPPKGIDLSYQPAEGNLTVKVLHGVKNAQKHFVERIVVYVAGKKVSEQSFSSQTSKGSLDTVVSVGSLPGGTEVRVEATCNIFGTKKATLVIP